MPLLRDQWLGTGPRPLELRRDRSWYARQADGSRIGFIFAIRQRNHYHDRKQSQGWRPTAEQVTVASVVKALVYLTRPRLSPLSGANFFLLEFPTILNYNLQLHLIIWNFISIPFSFHRIFYSSFIVVYFRIAGKTSFPISSIFLRSLSKGMPPKSI